MMEKELATSIQTLTALIDTRTSYRYRLLSGLITGVATAIGATVVAGGVLFVIGKGLQQLDLTNTPVVQQMLEEAHLLDDARVSPGSGEMVSS